MICDLLVDFQCILDAMPKQHRQHGQLSLLQEALALDDLFIARHRLDYPQALFQSLLNRLSWYDGNRTSAEDRVEHRGQAAETMASDSDTEKNRRLADLWEQTKSQETPGFAWVRSLRPPEIQLGCGQQIVLAGHTASVNCVACTHDGERVVTASNDSTIRIWNRRVGVEELCLAGHTDAVTTVKITRNDSRIVSGSADGSLRIWNLLSGDCLQEIQHSKGVVCACLSQDESLIAAGLQDGTVVVWEMGRQNEVRRINTSWQIRDTAFANDNHSLLVATGLYTHCYSLETGQLQYKQTSVRGTVWSLSVDWGAGCVASAGEQPSGIALWKTSNGRELKRFCGHTEDITCICLFDKAGQLASCSADRSVRIWNTSTGKQSSIWEIPEMATSCCVSVDGRFLICGTDAGTCRQFEIDAGRRDTVPQSDYARIGAVAMSRDGQHIATTSLFCPTIRMWNGDDGSLRHELFGHYGPMNASLQFSSDGRLLLSRESCEARIWDVDTSSPAVRFPPGLKLTDTWFSEDSALLVAKVDNPEWSERIRLENINKEFVIDCRIGKPLPIDVREVSVEFHPQQLGRLRCQSAQTRQETIISDREGAILAWFPLPVENICCGLKEGRWAGSYNSHLCLFELQPVVSPVPGMGAQNGGAATTDWLARFPITEEDQRSATEFARLGAGCFNDLLAQIAGDDLDIRIKALQSLAGERLSGSQRAQLAGEIPKIIRDLNIEPHAFFLLLPLLGEWPETLPASVAGFEIRNAARQLACVQLVQGFGAEAKPYLRHLLQLLASDSERRIADLVEAAISNIGFDATIPVCDLLLGLRFGNHKIQSEVCDCLDQLRQDGMTGGIVQEMGEQKRCQGSRKGVRNRKRAKARFSVPDTFVLCTYQAPGG